MTAGADHIGRALLGGVRAVGVGDGGASLLSLGRVHVLCMDSNGWIKVKCRRINDFRIASYHGTGLTILIFGEKKKPVDMEWSFLVCSWVASSSASLSPPSIISYHLPNSVSALQPRLHNKPSRRLLEYAHKPLNFNDV